VEPQDAPFLVPTKAKEIALTVFPERNVHGAVYGEQGEVLEVIFFETDPEFYRSVYLHPYSGEILKVENHEAGFFHFILEGHMHLWMPEDIGSNVVSIAVLLFLLILISGLILWWPRTKNKKKKFKFVWSSSTKWKRKNYDLHSIIGFYVLALAFILAFTGSVMTYQWFQNVTYRTAGGDKVPQFLIPENEATAADQQNSSGKPIDRLVPMLRREDPDAISYEVHYPHNEKASIYVEISNQEGVYYNSDYRFFDQYTLEEIETPGLYGHYKNADFADKVIRMNYDIHVGAIGGIPGKIIAFLASLLTATLPVTGFLLWYGRNYKKSTVPSFAGFKKEPEMSQ
jgi:uncharacterized iron-regulated membrane protein